MRAFILVLGLTAPLSACDVVGLGGITEENYASKAARIGCKKWNECAKGTFEQEYSDVPDCINDIEDDTQDAMDDLDDCDFEPAEAEKCLDEIRTGTCEDWIEGDLCEDAADIWDC